ncbi:MAG TPA: TRAM domain-containing protein [Acidimicrobiales bacterium]
MDTVEVEAGGVVAGGDAIARDADGRVVFVAGALPGERVVAEVVHERKDFRRAIVVDVLDASPDRVAPPCANLAAGCGGCAWQHVTRGAQPRLKVDVVRDALRRIAGDAGAIDDVAIVAVPGGDLRTTLRVAVRDGRAAFHRAGATFGGRSREGAPRAAHDDLVGAAGCLVAHPLLAELLEVGSFGDATEAVLRASIATGQRVAMLRPTPRGASFPDDVVVVGERADEIAAIDEVVAGRTFRVSARSFFQPNPAVAEVLVATVADALGLMPGGARLADLYAGVGLFGAVLGDRWGASVVAVEQSSPSVADARRNLADLDAVVVQGEVGRWAPDGTFDAVVADPARPGLGKPGVAAVVRAKPASIALVSCDAASLARDIRLLAGEGYAATAVRVLDAFPDTPHVEVVTAFRPV